VGDPGIAVLLNRLSSPDPLPFWEEFLHEYSPILYQVARAYTTDTDSAADCYLHICEQLARNNFRRLRKFRSDGKASFTTWLRVVARNLCFDWHRKQTGRFRPFKSIQSLSQLEVEIYMCRFERGLSPEQTLAELRPTSPGLDLAQLTEVEKQIETSLNSRQRWILQVRRNPASTATSILTAEDGEEEISRVADVRLNQEELIATEQQHAQISKYVATLPKFERLLIQMRFEQELSLDEIARLTGLGDAQRAHRHIAAALKKIRLAMGLTGKF